MKAGAIVARKKGIVAQIAEAMASREQTKQADAGARKRIDVTPERGKRNRVVSAGMARKIVPVIDTLWNAQQITDAEYSALAYYRDQASRAEDDSCMESALAPAKIMGGTSGTQPVGGYIPVSLVCTPAILETARIERDLGQLRDIARAIAVDDVSLSQWCIDKHGGRERYDGKGRFVALVPVSEKKHMQIARMELRMAAHRIVR